VLVLSWCSITCRLETLQSRNLICALNVNSIIKGVTMREIYDVISWSFKWLAHGVHPDSDHRGAPWPVGSVRQRRAGTKLTPCSHIAVYCLTAGDWKWTTETFLLPHSYSRHEVCHRCKAEKSPDALNYANWLTDAPWASTTRIHGEFLEHVNGPSGLMKIPGWHLHSMIDDFLHDDLLGMRQWACGGVLWELAWEGAWPSVGHGPWQARLDAILAQAFTDFRFYCREHNIHSSQSRFKSTMLGMSTLQDWPILKSKGHNCAMVSLWLAERCRTRARDEYSLQRASMMYGFAMLWHLFKNGSLVLTADEVKQLGDARVCTLGCYHYLSHAAASRTPTPEFRFPMKPKFHKLDHLCRLAMSTCINPGWMWGFSDEDLVGKVAKLAGATHASTMQNRTAERWLTFFWGELLSDG